MSDSPAPGQIVERVGAEAAEPLSAVHAQCFEQAWTAEAFASLLATPGTFAWMAWTADHEPLGLALVRIAAQEGEILTLATLPHRRRKGVARQIIEEILNYTRKSGVERLFLEVAEDNQAGRALYEKAGFSYVGRRPSYYGSSAATGRQDALILQRHTHDE
jgi:ribosomal-protein-alanine N-acetyltransferase